MDELENSLGDDATFAGGARESLSGISLGDEGTLGDVSTEQAAVVDDIEIVDIEARYQVETVLGRGGMGEVLLALDTRLDRKVAIKRILGDATRSKTAVERFLTEAKSIAALNHPNIVQIYDYGRAKDGPFLIMEYVSGNSLLERCKEEAISEEETVNVISQLCDGLNLAHETGIVHRDIKPANVLMTKEGVPKLTDFGLAKNESSDHQNTMTGSVLGTFDFMPPEQRRDASLVDARSDLWSLAATMSQLLTGKSPKVIQLQKLSAHFQSVLGKALEEAKEERFQTAREFRDALAMSTIELHHPQEMTAGQCSVCGVKNELNRKFCSKCAASLVVPCMACGDEIRCWEEICGHCGTGQEQLVESRRAELAVQQADAEGLLKENEFDAAQEIVAEIGGLQDSRFRDNVVWAENFGSLISESKEKLEKKILVLLGEAEQHEKAHDYVASQHALEQVMPSMRNKDLPGQSETVATALSRVSEKIREVSRLDRLVKMRIAAKDYDGLLVEVRKLTSLVPGRDDLYKIIKQLEGWEKKLWLRRKEIFAKIETLFNAHQYKSALDFIDTLKEPVWTSSVESKRSEIASIVRTLEELAESIETAAEEYRFQDAIELIGRYEDLQPSDSQFSDLKHECLEKVHVAAAETKKLIRQAKEHFEQCEFPAAISRLEVIPKAIVPEEAKNLIEDCRRFIELRSDGVRDLKAGLAGKTPMKVAAGSGGRYWKETQKHGLTDLPFESLYSKCLQAISSEQRGFRLKVLAAVLGSLLVVLILSWGFVTIRGVMSRPPNEVVEEKNDSAESIESVGRIDFTQAEKYDEFTGMPIRSGESEVDNDPFRIEVQPPSVFTDSVGISFVEIDAGSFVMGDDTGRSDERPHKVEIAKPFLMSVAEVTNLQWSIVMGDPSSSNSDIHAPVDNITWYEATDFCDKLSSLPETPANHTYRLPTEAEWEYACRAGSVTKWSFGSTDRKVEKYIRFQQNSTRSQPPFRYGNAWGLVDMHGNVAEWCADTYAPYSTDGTVVKPSGSRKRVVRGGSFETPLDATRSSSRSQETASVRRPDLGFRVVLEVDLSMR